MSLPSLPLFLEARKHASEPEKIAVIDKTKGQPFTYRQLLSEVSQLRELLLDAAAKGSSKTDLEEHRIAFLVPAGYDYVVCQWAVWAAGGVCVPLCMCRSNSLLLVSADGSGC
jgi:acyl-CoA synthetase (AMP-forming)/AMP-acid ligase II